MIFRDACVSYNAVHVPIILYVNYFLMKVAYSLNFCCRCERIVNSNTGFSERQSPMDQRSLHWRHLSAQSEISGC